jgi:hypothetical protein
MIVRLRRLPRDHNHERNGRGAGDKAIGRFSYTSGRSENVHRFFAGIGIEIGLRASGWTIDPLYESASRRARTGRA